MYFLYDGSSINQSGKEHTEYVRYVCFKGFKTYCAESTLQPIVFLIYRKQLKIHGGNQYEKESICKHILKTYRAEGTLYLWLSEENL